MCTTSLLWSSRLCRCLIAPPPTINSASSRLGLGISLWGIHLCLTLRWKDCVSLTRWLLIYPELLSPPQRGHLTFWVQYEGWPRAQPCLGGYSDWRVRSIGSWFRLGFSLASDIHLLVEISRGKLGFYAFYSSIKGHNMNLEGLNAKIYREHLT